jgi:hypothetical protein
MGSDSIGRMVSDPIYPALIRGGIATFDASGGDY